MSESFITRATDSVPAQSKSSRPVGLRKLNKATNYVSVAERHNADIFDNGHQSSNDEDDEDASYRPEYLDTSTSSNDETH